MGKRNIFEPSHILLLNPLCQYCWFAIPQKNKGVRTTRENITTYNRNTTWALDIQPNVCSHAVAICCNIPQTRLAMLVVSLIFAVFCIKYCISWRTLCCYLNAAWTVSKTIWQSATAWILMVTMTSEQTQRQDTIVFFWSHLFDAESPKHRNLTHPPGYTRCCCEDESQS